MIKKIYNKLHKAYGEQAWWPADSPFEVMVGAILTQNTNWTNVEKAIAQLKAHKALTPEAIYKARQLPTWIRSAGYYNIKAKRLKNFCHWYIEQGKYSALTQLPTDELRQGLLSVNGVGYETADDILLYAFHRPVFVVDAYTKRIMSRVGAVDEDINYEPLRHKMEKALKGDDKLYQQYHALIVQHAKIACRKKPICSECCLRKFCEYAPGIIF